MKYDIIAMTMTSDAFDLSKRHFEYSLCHDFQLNK